ncbi:uncharacterized protein LOC118403460 [Branchiostoma floridae]|uniref:Uncharacterized protein LOC118403460 n=1 Tax=Branchiostoma floridae TaxID=7739 RepID=A0A9J7KDU7_BRAFL|nr:uncharacterized protein LOC118403460 [Branchiostoma floridae]
MCFLLAQIYKQISVSATTAVPAATTDAVGLWPLNARFGASDITGNGNDGTSTGTQLAAGPYGEADGAFLFSGTANSYIDIPNNGKLDVRYSFTILAHVYPTGEDGPIFDYVGTNPNIWHWALHFWQLQPHDLQLRPIGRDGHFSSDVVARVLQLDAWNYVGGTYDSTTGVASLWSNGELAREQYIGVTEVASQHPVRVAVRAQDEDDPRYFAGRIACLQLYNYAMTQEQIVAARDACKESVFPTVPGQLLTTTSSSDIQTAYTCEWGTLHLSCAEGKTLLIMDATFGRASPDRYPACGCSVCTTDCRAASSLSVVRGACQGQQQCAVRADYFAFGGDPCSGVQKYLDTSYRCITGVWMVRDPSWVVDSTGTPWAPGNGVTYDAAKALDGDTETFWNPQGVWANWYIVLDLTASHTITRVAVNNYGDTIHDIADFTMQNSQVESPYNWEDVVTVTTVQGGTSQRQEFGGFQGTARYWRFLVTETHSGWQPWLKELDLYGLLPG